MNYKGNYSADTSYSVGDVAVLDNVAYELFEAAAAGTSPHNTHKWRRVIQPMQDMVMLFNSMLGSGAGGGLPEVTTDDNGDVLTVVEGEWAKATPSSGTDILFVTATYDDVEQTYTLNKTWTEIYNANVAIITFTDTDMKGIALVTEIEHTGEGYAVQDVNGTTYIADSANGYPVSDGGK